MEMCAKGERYMIAIEEYEIYKAILNLLNDPLSFQSNLIFDTFIRTHSPSATTGDKIQDDKFMCFVMLLYCLFCLC